MITIRFTADPLPDDFNGSLQDFQNRFLLNLRGTIQETQVLVGQIGGSRPITNVGAWLNQDHWETWNGSEYVPAVIKVGGAGYTVQLGDYTTVGASSDNIISTYTQTLQDKDGTVALLDDVYVGRPAVTLTTATPNIDWNLGHHFVQTLSANTTPTMTNSQDGQRIVYSARNNGTSYTFTWPSYIFWTTGSAPSQTASKTDLYIFENIAGSIFGRQVANYS